MPPMAFREVNGEPKGYIIDLWRKWSAETGVPVTFNLTNWANTLTIVKDGEADVHGGLFFTAERDKYLDYTLPFFPSKGALFVKVDSDVTSAEQLQGRPVGVIAKSFYNNLIGKQFPEMNPVPIPSSGKLVEAAANGEVDAFLADYPTLMYQIGSMGKIKEFKVVEYVSLQEFRAAVAEGDANLLAMIEEGLTLIDQDERDSIYNRWIIGETSQPREWLLPAVIFGFVGLLIAALLPVILGMRKG